jgi:hypothetical protein
MSPLPSLAMQLVPRYLLGELPPLATNTVSDLTPFIGRYIANFATFSNEVFTIFERNGRLVPGSSNRGSRSDRSACMPISRQLTRPYDIMAEGVGMGDKGGKKDKEKNKQQQLTKQKQEQQKKQDKARPRTP